MMLCKKIGVEPGGFIKVLLRMQARVTVYPKIYMSVEDSSWSARPSTMLARRLHSGEGSARWVGCVKGSHISIGDPISTDYMGRRAEILYLPSWFCESIGVEGGEELDIEFERSENLQKATRLSFKVIGHIPADMDIRDLIEEPLSQLGVLEEGQIVPVPVVEGTMILLESCEPEGVVFLDGSDIVMDLEMDEGEAEQGDAVAVARQEVNPNPEPVDYRYVLPASYYTFLTESTPSPFQGTGNRLG
jgi:hypothetical protein